MGGCWFTRHFELFFFCNGIIFFICVSLFQKTNCFSQFLVWDYVCHRGSHSGPPCCCFDPNIFFQQKYRIELIFFSYHPRHSASCYRLFDAKQNTSTLFVTVLRTDCLVELGPGQWLTGSGTTTCMRPICGRHGGRPPSTEHY